MNSRLLAIIIVVLGALGCNAERGDTNGGNFVPLQTIAGNQAVTSMGAGGVQVTGSAIAGSGVQNTATTPNQTGAAGTKGQSPGAAGKSARAGDTATGAGGKAAGAAGSNVTTTTTANGSAPNGIPKPLEPCPTMATGAVKMLGYDVNLWVGPKSTTQKGWVMIYWHGTSGGGNFANFLLVPGVLDEILATGGMIAAPTSPTAGGTTDDSAKRGATTGNNVWYMKDYEVADQIVACAVEQLNIDTQRIYSTGDSAGAIQAAVMAFTRSSYLAAATSNSGGLAWPGQDVLQDPSHVPPVLMMYGSRDQDVVIIVFEDTSKAECAAIAAKGGLAIDCGHGGAHCSPPADLKAASWQFMKEHPFGVNPEPYAGGLPASFPSYCKITKAQ